MQNATLVEAKNKGLVPITKKKATRGKHDTLHGYWKGIAATFVNKEDRRHFLNMMLDAVVSEKEAKENQRRSRDNKDKGE